MKRTAIINLKRISMIESWTLQTSTLKMKIMTNNILEMIIKILLLQ